MLSCGSLPYKKERYEINVDNVHFSLQALRESYRKPSVNKFKLKHSLSPENLSWKTTHQLNTSSQRSPDQLNCELKPS